MYFNLVYRYLFNYLCSKQSNSLILHILELIEANMSFISSSLPQDQTCPLSIGAYRVRFV